MASSHTSGMAMGQSRHWTLDRKWAVALQSQLRKRTLMAAVLRRKRLLVVFRLARVWLLARAWAFSFPRGKSLAIGSGSVEAESQSWTLDAGRN